MQNALILLAAIAAALAIGFAMRARAGRARAVGPGSSPNPGASSPASGPSPTDQNPEHESPDLRRLLLDAGLSPSSPTVLHFSATWCGPCAAVRRVVEQTLSALAAEGVPVVDLELDIDENPTLAKELKVMSLPTTFVYDASGALTHRIAGVPKADALRAALHPSR